MARSVGRNTSDTRFHGNAVTKIASAKHRYRPVAKRARASLRRSDGTAGLPTRTPQPNLSRWVCPNSG